MILTDCPTCGGYGWYTEHRGMRHPKGGNPEPIEVDVDCRECAGQGRVLDPDFYTLHEDVLSEVPVECAHCGTVRIPYTVATKWWQEALGWLAECQCGSHLLLTAKAVEAYIEEHPEGDE